MSQKVPWRWISIGIFILNKVHPCIIFFVFRFCSFFMALTFEVAQNDLAALSRVVRSQLGDIWHFNNFNLTLWYFAWSTLFNWNSVSWNSSLTYVLSVLRLSLPPGQSWKTTENKSAFNYYKFCMTLCDKLDKAFLSFFIFFFSWR